MMRATVRRLYEVVDVEPGMLWPATIRSVAPVSGAGG
ncbi:hypothetical protein NAEX_01474 [Nannocystis exedens]|nr:hypothetical protein NAEX_01474 [Nannocystis exedens]